MGEAAHDGRDGTNGGPRAVVVDGGISSASFTIVELERCGSTVLEEIRLGQCWVKWGIVVPQRNITNGKGGGPGVGVWWLVGVFANTKQVEPRNDARIGQCFDFLGGG